MTLIGLMVARNEAWCLPASIPAAMKWLDVLIILIHASTDATLRIVSHAHCADPNRIHFACVDRTEWNEADDRRQVLKLGRLFGGTHFAILDADEIAIATAMGNIRNRAMELHPGQMLRLPWVHCWRGLDRFRCDDSPFGRATVPMVFADSPGLSYSPDSDGYQFHMRCPRGASGITWGEPATAGILHLQHAVWRRLLAKQALYQMTEVLRWGDRRPPDLIAQQYGGTVDETGLRTSPIPPEWWPVDPHLIDLDAAPWQEEEVLRLIEFHGRERFEGLDMFGL